MTGDIEPGKPQASVRDGDPARRNPRDRHLGGYGPEQGVPAAEGPVSARALHGAARQQARLRAAGQEAGAQEQAEETVPPAFALTPMQQGLLYESAAIGRPWVNLEQIVVHLDGEAPEPEALCRAWQQVCADHAMLRSAILWQGRDTPVQQIHPAGEAARMIRVEPRDWQHLEAQAQRRALARFLREDRNRGVALETPLSWRVALMRLGGSRSVMVWTIHHVLVDGRSMSLVLEDLFAHLEGRVAGQALVRPDHRRDHNPDHRQGPKGGQGNGSAPQDAGFHVFAPAVAQAAAREETRAFFRTQLAGVEQPNRIAPLSEGFADLQTDPGDIRPVGPIARGRKRQLHHQLSAQLRRDLVARAARAGATLADMIHVAWGVLIARWSGQSRAVFGVTRSGRYLVAGSARMVGCLINTLPLHLRLSSGIGLDDLLGAVRRDTVAMRPHEQASLAEMRQCCDLPADMALFDTMVMFERDSLGARMRGLGGAWATRRVELHEEGAMPLTLAVYGDACPQLVLEYDPEAVPEAQAQRMLGHFRHLLDQLAQAPVGLALSDLDMLPDAERMCLQRWGRPEGARRLARDLAEGPVCMARRLAARAALQPEAPAVVGAWSTPQEGAALSHGQLQARANRLAVQLQLRGAGPGDIIAICLPRSVDFVIAMLAVLKTGAAFLPVDPDYPPAVVAHMLQDSQARLGVTAAGDLPISESDMVEYDPILRNVTWVSPQGATLRGAHQPDSRPGNHTDNQPSNQTGRQTGKDRQAPAPVLPDPDPARLAYVIYTSGSTGKPKGVKVPMRALMAHALAIAAEFDLSDQDRVLQFASLSFDVSIEEILPSLLAGGCVILRDADMLAAPLQFLERVGALKISVLNLPTAFWHMLCDSMAESGHRLPASVRLVIAGGEQVNAQTLARWQAMVPDVRWLNGYGPTETTITCTLFDPGGPVDALQDIPIGRPVAHALAYVLGPDGSLAPAGVAGDLWIGGLAVSDGYIARPETTARSFRPDPRAPVPLLTAGAGPAQIYRTGDRAAWREDGTLAFLGRQDRQVKLRGFRIDLRHVEQVLERARPGLRALAAVRGADGPAAQLCCWVQDPAWQGPQVTEADLAPLQAVVQTELPAHMRPALVGVLRFVRTAGGKIDTAALPAPRPARSGPVASGAPGSGLGSDPAAPASALARRIADLMGDVLDQPGLAVDAGFYDQGGHSLLAMRLIGRIEAELGAQLSPVALHQAPSPRLLAALLEGEHSEARGRRSLPGGSHPGTAQGSGPVSSLGATLPRHLVPIQTGGDLPPLFGVHVLGRNEEFYRPLAATLGPQQPVYGLTVGGLDAETPTGVKITAARYFDEIQTHYPQGVVHLAAVSLGAYFAFELACRLQAAGRSLGMVALFDAEGPGGRCRVQGLGRICAHLRLMQRMGLGYLGHVAGNRLHGLRRRLMHRHIAQNGAEARLAEGPDSDLSIEALIAANQQSVARYDPAPLPVPLTIFRAGDDLFDSAEGLRQGLGWAPVAGAGFDLIDVPGTHLGILSPPNVEILGRHMAQVLARHDGTDV